MNFQVHMLNMKAVCSSFPTLIKLHEPLCTQIYTAENKIKGAWFFDGTSLLSPTCVALSNVLHFIFICISFNSMSIQNKRPLVHLLMLKNYKASLSQLSHRVHHQAAKIIKCFSSDFPSRTLPKTAVAYKYPIEWQGPDLDFLRYAIQNKYLNLL